METTLQNYAAEFLASCLVLWHSEFGKAPAFLPAATAEQCAGQSTNLHLNVTHRALCNANTALGERTLGLTT